MAKIGMSFDYRWQILRKLTKVRMLTDAEYFKTKIGGLDGAGDVGDYIVNLVKEKSVPKDKVPAPVGKDETAANGKNSSEITPSPDTAGEDGGKEESKIELGKTDTLKELQAAQWKEN